MSPQSVQAEYQAGITFNQGIELYEGIETNENFFIGKQWEGVQSNGMPTPVFNFLKRVVLFAVANVTTDNWKLHASVLPGFMGHVTDPEFLAEILNNEFLSIFEQNRMSGLLRRFTRNAAVDGDGCTYTYWDPDVETGQWSKGAIRTELLQNHQVLFGNPNSKDVQSQPYILLERRLTVKEARKRAKAFGQDASEIVADSKETGNVQMDAIGGSKVTVLTKLWKNDKTGTVWGYECTSEAVVRPAWDLGIKRYPITWMCWDFVQDCYHGQAMITGLIPNQIFVNKSFAMAMIFNMSLAYPKVVFDRTKVPHWSNRVGSAIGVSGPVTDVAKVMDPGVMGPQVTDLINLSVKYSQEFLGASDVALGNSRPDNAAAVIALQRAAAVPMELTRQDLMESIEDLGRIYIDFMGAYYGQRYVSTKDPQFGENVLTVVDFSVLQDIPMTIDLDAGASAYWSEIASMQTMDNLLQQGKISAIEYIKRLPAGMISDRDKLIAIMEQEQRMQMQAAGLPPDMMPPPGAVPEGNGPAGAEEAPLEIGPGNRTLQRELVKQGVIPGTGGMTNG